MNIKFSYMKKAALFLFLLIYSFGSAQVGINSDNSAPDVSAMLDIKSISSGLLIPRMTAADRDNIASPATGLTVYVTDDNSFYYFDGTNWIRLQESGKSWLLAGNAGTSGTEFLGTTDAQPLIFKTNNTERVKIDPNGYIGVNTAPDSNNQFTVRSDDKDIIGYFESTRNSSDDIAVQGIAAAEDFWGIGGKFKGGYYGVQAYVFPTGSGSYFGLSAKASGGTGTNFGIDSYARGTSANSGITYGVKSIAGDAKTNYGGYFLGSRSSNDSGTKNYGIYSKAFGSEKNYGGMFETITSSDNGSAGYFKNSDDTGIGIIAIGNNLSNFWHESNGSAIAATGKTYAICGYSENDDSDTVCIYGEYKGTDNSADATGVQGYSDPKDYWGYGVKGIGGFRGVYGVANQGQAGVYGFSNASSYGVYSNGDTGASGTKSFVIDHPLDPENKYLKHFSIESNEVLNVYRGNVVLDSNGEASIRLPYYFHAVNRNYSYMLTPVGQPAPGIYVSKEIDSNGDFKIAGGQAGQKISWYVYAERNDPYLQYYPEKRKVEVDKAPKERGKYLRPELYGKPQSMSVEPQLIKSESIKAKTESVPAVPVDPKKKNTKEQY